MDKYILALIYLLLGLHLVGVSFGLYIKTTWFDIPMHILGGAWIMLAAMYAYRRTHWRALLHPLVLFMVVLIVVLCWEAFEYAFNAIGPPGDSLVDIVMGLSGAAVVYGLMRGKYLTTQ